jgi:hypothetical protein
MSDLQSPDHETTESGDPLAHLERTLEASVRLLRQTRKKLARSRARSEARMRNDKGADSH